MLYNEKMTCSRSGAFEKPFKTDLGESLMVALYELKKCYELG